MEGSVEGVSPLYYYRVWGYSAPNLMPQDMCASLGILMYYGLNCASPPIHLLKS